MQLDYEGAAQALIDLADGLRTKPGDLAAFEAVVSTVARDLGFEDAGCWKLSSRGEPAHPVRMFGADQPE